MGQDRDRPEDILATYGREAATWARQRNRSLWERPALEACVAGRAPGLRVLDLGCGSGQPIAEWFIARGDAVTGVDGAAAMLAEAHARVPEMERVLADMRGLALGRDFDILLAFNSFFHLSPDDQRAMFTVFAAHAAPDARLLLTTGPAAAEAVGRVGQSPVYHASLEPSEYRALLAAHGFAELWFRPEDAELAGHSVWLARFAGNPAAGGPSTAVLGRRRRHRHRPMRSPHRQSRPASAPASRDRGCSPGRRLR